MRLISCYVEGYGAIHKKEYRFDEGITPFLWGNGEGKTTLSSFIKAMFYGMEKEKKNSLYKNGVTICHTIFYRIGNCVN